MTIKHDKPPQAEEDWTSGEDDGDQPRQPVLTARLIGLLIFAFALIVFIILEYI